MRAVETRLDGTCQRMLVNQALLGNRRSRKRSIRSSVSSGASTRTSGLNFPTAKAWVRRSASWSWISLARFEAPTDPNRPVADPQRNAAHGPRSLETSSRPERHNRRSGAGASNAVGLRKCFQAFQLAVPLGSGSPRGILNRDACSCKLNDRSDLFDG